MGLADLKPKTDIDERLAILCILPLLLAGVLGVPSMREQLPIYLRSLVFHQVSKHGALSPTHTPELINAMRFLWCVVPLNSQVSNPLVFYYYRKHILPLQ